MATHSSTLAWRIPWREEPGRLQSMGSQSQTRLSDFTSLLHMCSRERERERERETEFKAVPMVRNLEEKNKTKHTQPKIGTE